jgi:RiboL-PSP-HEPN
VIDATLLNNFLDQFDGLKKVVTESAERSIQDPPDALFYEHQNIFIKAYLVSACSMLEAFIQDLAYAYVEVIQNRINGVNLPFNMIMWAAEHEKARLDFKRFTSNKAKKDISDLISPNYYKTMKAFAKVGIDLSASNIDNFKDLITSKVEKRNKIVHDNDEALDLSFADIVDTIDKFKEYTICLFDCVCADPHLTI